MAEYAVYAEERLRLLKRLRQEAGGASLGELFRPSSSELRFHLGTSLADLRIPYRISTALSHAFERAAIGSYLLSGHRHKGSLPTAEFDRLVVTEGFDPAALRPLSFNPPGAVTREQMLRSFARASEDHIGVDAGLLAAFIGTGQAGRELGALLHALLSKARDEGRRSETGEPTVYLVSLMLRAAADRAFMLTREGPVSEPMARFLRTAVATLLAESVWLAVREAGLTREAGLLPGATPAPATDLREARACLLSTAALGLLPFLGARPALFGGGLAAYGAPFEASPPRLDDALTRIGNGDEPELIARDLAALFPKDRDHQRRMDRLGAFAILREKLRELSRAMETLRATVALPVDGSVDRLITGRESLERLFSSESRRKELTRVLRDAIKPTLQPSLREGLEFLAHAARDYREEEPAAWLGPPEARLRAARAVVALAADITIERAVAPAAQLLLERAGTESEAGAQGEYESGRLYLLGTEDQPLLRSRVRAPQVGHLFCDLKDFTRRTAVLKESVIADFLHREFYTPMLALASGIDPGSRRPTAPVDLSLNNLVGDAASFSGDIVALMRLAKDVRNAFRGYDKRLAAEASNETISAHLAELEARYRSRRDALERSIRELLARAPQAEPSIQSAMLMRAQHSKAELQRLEALFASEKAQAAGEGIEAGIFISYGAAPEVARFEDPVFGTVKVAIAEKINESARGTARNGGVRDRVEAMRQRASKVAGKNLELPFAVLVDQTSNIPLAATEALAIADLFAAGETQQAEDRLLAIARKALQRRDEVGDIYNNGIACSEEALNAYLEARSNDVIIVPREIPVASLHESLRDRFFFPRDPLRVVACLSQTKSLTDLFVFQGRALFRGFEAAGGLGVYEIIERSSPLFTGIAQHHAASWFAG